MMLAAWESGLDERVEKTSFPEAEPAPDLVAGRADLVSARRGAALSIGVNLGLALGKGAAGLVSGSAALLGDAIHSATDVIGSAAAYVGLSLAGRRHPSFPYGLYKAETLATLFISGAVILAGYEIGRQAIVGPDKPPNFRLALPVALISLAVTLAFGLYQLGRGRRLHSPALLADARDYLTDAGSTAVVAAGLAGAYLGLSLDRWAAAVVALFVFWSGGQLLWSAVRDLLDQAIDRETERQIIRLVEAHPRVEQVERVLSRTAGGRFIVDLDVTLRAQSHQLADRIADQLEAEISRQFPLVVLARVRAHSRQSEQLLRLTPVQEPGGAIEAHLARAPWFLKETLDRSSQRIIGREYLENPHGQAEKKRGFLVGRWLLGLKPDQVVVAEEKEGTAVALLREAGVEVIPAAATPGPGQED